MLLASLLSAALPACDCDPPPPVAEALAQATAVFAGKVLSVERPAGVPVQVTIVADLVWKGVEPGSLELTTPRDDCGFSFQAGHQYLVYCTGELDALHTDVCTRTHPLAGLEEEIAALDAALLASVPPEADDEEPPAVAPAEASEAPAPVQTDPVAERRRVRIVLSIAGVVVLIGIIFIVGALMRARSSLSFPRAAPSGLPDQPDISPGPAAPDTGDDRPERTPRRHQGR
jgi:hypothetical protein